MSNQKKLTDDDIIPMEVLIGGRSYAHHWQSGVLNSRTYLYWLHILRSLALSSFQWDGFDEIELDPRFIELCMLDYGSGAFFDMDRGGAGMFAFAQMAPMSRLNLYWDPNRIRLMPANGGRSWYRHAYFWTKKFDNAIREPDAVVLYDNINRRPINMILSGFARRLENCDRKMDININAQSTPMVFNVDERERKSAQSYFQQITGNEPLILANRKMPESVDPTVLNLEAPFVADKIEATKKDILNDALTMLGIDNTNTEKKERMIDAEATSNNEEIMLMRRSRLSTRREFCRKCNTLFGTNLSVKYAVPHLQQEGNSDVDMGGMDGEEKEDGNGSTDTANSDGVQSEA